MARKNRLIHNVERLFPWFKVLLLIHGHLCPSPFIIWSIKIKWNLSSSYYSWWFKLILILIISRMRRTLLINRKCLAHVSCFFSELICEDLHPFCGDFFTTYKINLTVILNGLAQNFFRLVIWFKIRRSVTKNMIFIW